MSTPPPAVSSAISGWSFKGKVLDTAGKPVYQAKVRAVRLHPTRFTSSPVRTDIAGNFTIGNLGDGTYSLCATANPRRQLLDDCFWLDASGSAPVTPKSLRIAGGQATGNTTVQMQRGRIIQVQVKDTAKTLGSRHPRGGARTVQVHLVGPRGTMPRALHSTRPERDGQSYEILAPANIPMRVRVEGVGIAVADELLRPLPNGRADVPVQFPAAASAAARHVFNISVQN